MPSPTPVIAAKYGRRFIACDETCRAAHTTRNRLIEFKSVFSFERQASFDFARPAPKGTKAGISKDSIRLETSLDLDYWEIDPARDGKIFTGARPRPGVRREAAGYRVK